jgi:hypothetical protein
MAAVLAFKKRAWAGVWAGSGLRVGAFGRRSPGLLGSLPAGLGGACPAEAEAEIALPPKDFSPAAHGPQSL